MDFSSQSLAISVALFLVMLWMTRNRRAKTEAKLLAPKASGDLPIIGHLHLLLGPKTLARTMSEMADRHGPVFRIQLGAHQAVVINSYTSMKECCTMNDRSLASRPQSSQAEYLGYNSAAFVFSPYGAYWRNIRKMANVELLSSQRIKSMKHFYEDEISDFLKELYLQSNKGSNGNSHVPVRIGISEWIHHLIVNIMARMIAGKRLIEYGSDHIEGCGNNDGLRPIGVIVREFMYVIGIAVPSDLIPFLKWMDIGGFLRIIKRIRNEMDTIIGRWIEEHKLKRLQGNSHIKQDFMDVMLSTIQEDTMFGHPRETIIKATTMTFNFAGSDTSSVTLTWILSNLLNNRRVLELTQEELDLKVGRDRVVQDSDIEKLVYLQAVIKETLRLNTPGPVIPREAAEDCIISGYYVPKGTRVFFNLWKLHRDPNIWSNPDEFIPERFLTKHANLDVYGQHFEYLPFGSGRRSCPGINLAMEVLQFSLARLLQAYNLATPSNQPVDMTEGLGISMPKESPLEVILTPRLAPQLY